MRAAIGAMHDMVNLDPAGRATTIDATPAAVAMPDKSLHAGRDVLVRPIRRRAIDRPDMLRIAQRALHGRILDDDLCTRALLPALAAALAHGHRDLKLRSTSRLSARRAIEDCAAQRHDKRIFGQIRPVLVVEHHARLAQQRVGLGLELEPNHMRLRLGIGRIIRPITGPMMRDHVLHLAQLLADCLGEPERLRRRRRHTRQLTHRGMRQPAICQCRRQLRQRPQRPRHAQSILRRPRRVMEHALQVIER